LEGAAMLVAFEEDIHAGTSERIVPLKASSYFVPRTSRMIPLKMVKVLPPDLVYPTG